MKTRLATHLSGHLSMASGLDLNQQVGLREIRGPSISVWARLQIILVTACFFGLLTPTQLWLSSPELPHVPVAPWFPVVGHPWDAVMFGLVLASLGAALKFYRPAILCFLSATLFLYCGDQNRGQPWLYLYWIMLLLTLFSEPTGLAGCRFVCSAAYVWAGLQKCNAAFFQTVPPFFAQPFVEAGLPNGWVKVLETLVAGAPAVEIFIGLAVWWSRTRPFAMGAAVLVHVTALVALGPLGHDHNRVVWPWNLAMIALVLTLFGNARLSGAWKSLRRSRLATGIVALVWLLPVLSFWGRWDSYLSFSLYSANLAAADISLSQELRDRLPPALQPYVHPAIGPYDPRFHRPFVFDHQAWTMKALGAPAIPEPRGFHALFQHLRRYATREDDLRMIVAPRHGPLVFYEGSRQLVLQPGPGTAPVLAANHRATPSN